MATLVTIAAASFSLSSDVNGASPTSGKRISRSGHLVNHCSISSFRYQGIHSWCCTVRNFGSSSFKNTSCSLVVQVAGITQEFTWLRYSEYFVVVCESYPYPLHQNFCKGLCITFSWSLYTLCSQIQYVAVSVLISKFLLPVHHHVSSHWYQDIGMSAFRQVIQGINLEPEWWLMMTLSLFVNQISITPDVTKILQLVHFHVSGTKILGINSEPEWWSTALFSSTNIHNPGYSHHSSFTEIQWQLAITYKNGPDKLKPLTTSRRPWPSLILKQPCSKSLVTHALHWWKPWTF